MKTYFRFLLIFSLFSVLLACSSDNDAKYEENVTITPNEITGTVGGLVLDAATNAPLEGVNITVVAGGMSYAAVTDASGIYSVENITAANGNVTAYFSANGYLPAHDETTFNIPGGDASYTQTSATTSTILLVPTTGSFSLKLVDPEGNPIPQVTIRYSVKIQYFVYDHNGNINAVGEFSKLANTNALGLAEFSGLPDLEKLERYAYSISSVIISIPEVDIDGDGFADYSSSQITYDQIRNNTTQIVQLNYLSYSSLYITDSNNPYFTHSAVSVPGAFVAGDNINIVFSKSPLPDSVSVILQYKDTENNGANDAMWELEPSITGKFMTVTLPEDIQGGKKYYMTVIAQEPSIPHDFYIKSVPLFSKNEDDTEITITLEQQDPLNIDSPIFVTFSEPVGLGNSYPLSGNNGVVYFNYDLDGDGAIGNNNGETGFGSSSYALYSQESTPNWLTGYSNGYIQFSKYWKFTPPTGLNAGTTIDFLFSSVLSSGARLHTPSGKFVPNISVLKP